LKTRLRLLLGALALLCAARPVAAQGKPATVSLLEGNAQKRREGRVAEDLKVGATVQQGDVVETADDSRLELKLADASVFRVGPRARLALTAVRFERGPPRRQPSVRLFFGKIWANLTSAVGATQKFQVETENAVLSVRGTTFRVDAHEDKSVLVRVYNGSVAVARPQPVSRPRWERLVGRQMQILIAADGTPGLPSAFSEADEKDDDWAAWNRKRDGQGK
jgi:hypothetical protein